MSRLRWKPAAALVAASLAGCGTPAPEEALCSATVAMGEELQTDDAPSQASIDVFAAASEEISDPELRDPAARAAAALATSPDEAIDPLGEVYDRCVELGLIADGTRAPADGASVSS